MKFTYSLRGVPVHIDYQILDNQIVTWGLNTESYQQVSQELVQLTESMLREHHNHEICMAVLEHSFYQDIAAPSYPDVDLDEEQDRALRAQGF